MKKIKESCDETLNRVLRTKVAAALMPSFLSPNAVNWDHGPETQGKIDAASALAVKAADSLMNALSAESK